MEIVLLFDLLFFGGAICLIIWAIWDRSKEKKEEKTKHKDYDKY